MDDNNQQWLNPKPPANLPSTPPPDRPKTPAPPPPEITLRTMASDLESLKQTGGVAPEPKPFTPLKITPAEFSEPKKFTPPTPVIEEEKPKGGLKKVLTLAVSLAVIAGAGLAGYYFIFPALFPAQTPPPPPAVTAPPTEIPAVPAAETAQPKPHQSLLLSPDLTSPATLATVDLASAQTVLQQEAQKALPTGTLSEIVLSGLAGGQIPTSRFLPTLLPELSSEKVKALFEEDFTAALYFDANDAWPAYILKLSPEATLLEAQAEVSQLEFSPNLKNLFVSDPGAPNSAGFKTGQASGVATRYLTYSKSGASLNIAWSGDKLIISASYSGLKKILSNL